MEYVDNEKHFSKKVRAGKRTYFFDVKATKGNDYYLTLTESRKVLKNGEMAFEKSKIFVYKEDLEKMLETLNETVTHIKKELLPHVDFSQFRQEESELAESHTSSYQETGSSELKWE
ncbi:MAG: DUF3276 family protein [Leadbetterella sp.]